MAEMLGVIKNGSRFLIGGGGASAEDIGVRYDEENDMVQLYYNGQWRDWKVGGMSYPIGGTETFEYTGTIVEFPIPATGRWKLECWGAQGGSSSNAVGGKGGYSVGEMSFQNEDIIYVVVGGAGKPSATTYLGGYNGGGSVSSGRRNYINVGTGGGATHIATRTGILSSLNDYRDTILMVAGGGGGAGGVWDWTYTSGGAGGAGGGTSGGAGSATNGSGNIGAGGGGGTQSSGGSGGSGENPGGTGSFGQGGGLTGDSNTGAGGGGGYYGGGQGGNNIIRANGGGGGGSGYINNTKMSNYIMTNGVREGNGYVILTYLGI